LLKTTHYILLGLVLSAFAGNSLLNRLALKPLDAIDPTSFTFVRLVSGALTLILLVLVFEKKYVKPSLIHYRGAVYLFCYAIAFSYAYISLDAAVGALILFGVVQICIIGVSIFRGKQLHRYEWLGCFLAIVGLLVLTLPSILNNGANASLEFNKVSVVLMVIAGVAWGLYTINGAGSKQPFLDTAICFILSVPLVSVALVIALINQAVVFSSYGIFLAVLSGAITSGVGYALWYQLLPMLSASQAATSQLLVPMIAAVGGFIFLSEALTLNFILASLLTLGGVLIVIRTSK